MASTALVKDLIWRVSVLLGDTAPQFQRFTEGELVRWLIDGQVALAKYLPSACSRVDTFKLAVGTRQSIDTIPAANCLPGDGVALTAPVYGVQLIDIVRNMGTDGLTPGNAINKAVRDDLDNYDEGWHTRVLAGTPLNIQNYVYDERYPTTFYVTPGVAVGQLVWIEGVYAAVPKVIPNTGAPGTELYLVGGASTQTITVADKFVDDLVNYVLARAQLKDSKFAEATKTALYGGLFVNSINAQVKALTGSSPNLQHLPGVQPQI